MPAQPAESNARPSAAFAPTRSSATARTSSRPASCARTFAPGAQSRDDEVGAAHDVGLIFIDERDRVYLSVTGRASVVRDAVKTKEVWTETDDIWLPGGPDDPNVRLLRMQPVTAELWDGPSSAAVVAVDFATKRWAC